MGSFNRLGICCAGIGSARLSNRSMSVDSVTTVLCDADEDEDEDEDDDDEEEEDDDEEEEELFLASSSAFKLATTAGVSISCFSGLQTHIVFNEATLDAGAGIENVRLSDERMISTKGIAWCA